MDEFLLFSLPPLLIAALAAIACALPGNFLLLSRRAMLGDAMSHVVLPGIVAAFLLTGSASGAVMGAGALAAAAASALLIEAVTRRSGMEPGAAMAVVFTAMFALGVVLLETTGTAGVHLDVEHALYGNLESLIWLGGPPPELLRLALVAAGLALALRLVWRPLTLATFDPVFAQTQGVPVALLRAGLTGATALAAVAAFQAVGSILTIAMLICPAAAARLLTRSLPAQLAVSLGLAIGAAVLGTVLAGYAPLWLGLPFTLSAAGMIATVSGLMLATAALIASHRAPGTL
ncbi:metal ABC transporter permease [Pseudorhodobacter sp. MZDSW-24AT]|uniref:metal ABC transporter permease n=1 Tax=Pseudorhodobacter sp. MZDSW-24AT TaxID=2052957 RepID=UPI000C1F1B08|nr:metal ABC transporter permease [Pseudorhodobacter sp. MZDSW-24AT]PJF07841.1 zinc ABC transporter permease [Pseudorhodobacter sp. MZDSW-24AT]